MTDSSITVLPSKGEAFSNEAAACGLLAEFYLHNPDVDFAKALGELIPEGFTDDSRIQTAVGILCTEAEKVRSNEEPNFSAAFHHPMVRRLLMPFYF